ncbi:hypothetical protein [Gemmata obscuriglobus]|uniref:hypothetical protein n=1 Tax=Gemmata obscuriglobus TaxID=114 RepID=UPI00137C1EA5|nr:hypothetical protein [Gemmata obscuriglobus]VTR99447.1 unnamed protein product [Gemmata obscuriglobus UQM 2246]
MSVMLCNWAFWRIPAIVAWFCLGFATWRVFAPDSVNVRFLWVALYPLCVGCVHLISQRLGTFLLYSANLVFFPVLATVWLVRKMHYPAILLHRATHSYTAPVYLMLVAICVIVLTNLDNLDLIQGFSLLLVAINFFLVVSGVRWATNPVKPVNALTQLFHELCVTVRRKDPAKHTADEVKKDLNNIVLIFSYLTPILRRFEAHVVSSISFGFMLYFLMLFGVTVVSYASIYYALAAIGEEQLKGLSPHFYDCLLYSVSVLTTSPLGGIETVSRFAKTMYCLELLSTVSLVTLFVSIFSVGLSMQEGSINEIKDRLTATGAHMMNELNASQEAVALLTAPPRRQAPTFRSPKRK